MKFAVICLCVRWHRSAGTAVEIDTWVRRAICRLRVPGRTQVNVLVRRPTTPVSGLRRGADRAAAAHTTRATVHRCCPQSRWVADPSIIAMDYGRRISESLLAWGRQWNRYGRPQRPRPRQPLEWSLDT